jgi:two-component system, cell cycle response regulator
MTMAAKRVLLVDDSPIYRHLVGGHLREWGYDVVIANDGTEAWKALASAAAPSLAVIDWVMPGMNGVELCRKLREQGPSERYVYTILLTAKDAQADWLNAMDAGVDDYLKKPFDPLELKARLKVGARIATLQEDAIVARESMRALASTDCLTGMPNRREILAFLTRELLRAQREHSALTIMIADIDHFKSVNDKLGHLTGDEVLKEVVRRLQSGLRPYDRVGRFGGEEFLIVMPGCELVPAFTRADQLRTLVGGTKFVLGAATTDVTISIGIASVKGLSHVELVPLLHLADLGLYKAKRNGRNRIEQVDECESEPDSSLHLLT